MYVAQVVQKIKHTICNGTSVKKVVVISGISQHKDFGIYHMLFLGVKLP